MMTRTALPTRTRAAAAGAALAAAALTMTACGGGSSAAGETESPSASASSGPQAWIAQNESNAGEIMAVDGSKVTYLALPGFEDTCPQTKQALEDIKAGAIKTTGDSDKGTYQIESTGTINDAKTRVMWDDVNGSRLTGDESGPGTITIEPDMITLENVFQVRGDDIQMVTADSAEGQKLVAQACEDS